MKYKWLSFLLFVSLLGSCASDGSDGSHREAQSTTHKSGLLEVGILAEGME